MDIQVGDRITGKWLDNNQIVTEFINSEGTLDTIISNMKNKDIEILKIERPKYEVVEEEKELLTKEEREFLRQILKFGNYGNETIKHIIKDGCYIELYYEVWAYNNIYIDKNLYFKNLEENKEYTLKELGLEEK